MSYPHLFPSHHCHLHFLFIIIAIFIFFPSSLCEYDGYDGYSNCTPSLFNCGHIQNITYPFRENGTQDYCGYPGFELECSEEEATFLVASEEQYRVLEIDTENRSMRIVQKGLSEDTICSSGDVLVNTTLNNTIFNYASGYTNLTLFFSCSSNSTTIINEYSKVDVVHCSTVEGHFSCSSNSTTRYFRMGEVSCSSVEGSGVPFAVGFDETQAGEIAKTGECDRIAVVPVTTTQVEAILNKPASLGTVLVAGFVLRWDDVVDEDCAQCIESNGKCGYNTTLAQPTCFCPDQIAYQKTCPLTPTTTVSTLNWKRKLLIVIGPSFLSVIAILLAILLYYLRRKSSSNGLILFWKRSTRNTQNVEAFLKNYGSLAPKRFSYRDIKKMTNSFKEKVGQGGFGGVFKGKLPDGRLVAVKVLNDSKGSGEDFINEVASIGRTCHVNIVTFQGFCVDGSKRALIYEFMSNGSLEKFIYNKKSMETCPHLGWERLHQIAVGIAKGLEYLHRGCTTRILHFDIKPHNILLDDDFCPKISDFGLAKLCPKKDSIISMADARGTIGYIAPEVFSRNFGGVSHKSDVYSYGMMILEMVGGRKNNDSGVDHTSENSLPHRIYKHFVQGEHLRLDMVQREEEEEIAKKMVLVGLWCIQVDPTNRPSVSKVVEMLEGNLESLPIPPMPYLFSAPRTSG